MRKLAKIAGLVLAGLLALIVVTGGALFLRGRSRAAYAPAVAVRAAALSVPSDSVAIARGRHLANAITPCEICHGPSLRGKPFGTPAMLVAMTAPNLTAGRGGIGAAYDAADWDRAIRHGVAKDGRSLIIMPSEAYTHLTDADFAALVAYLKSLPPADNPTPARKLGVLGGALIGAGVFPLAVNVIDHASAGTRTVVPATSREYGQYIVDVAGCRICHGADLEGGKSDGGPPPGPSLVSRTRDWSLDNFRSTIRTGRTRAGRALDPEQMPWPFFARMTDEELEALWLYVRSLPPAARTAR
jgi:mono/diheme cytochrome c family protein